MSGLSFSGIVDLLLTFRIGYIALIALLVYCTKLFYGKRLLKLEERISALDRPANVNIGGDNNNVVVNNYFNKEKELYQLDVSTGANTIVMTASVPIDVHASAELNGSLDGSISSEASLGPLPSDDPETEEQLKSN